MTVFSEAQDPTANLRQAPVSKETNFVNEIRSSAGWLVGSLDQIIGFLLNFSPLEKWVAKPFAGDWDALDRARQAWIEAGNSFRSLGENLDTVADQVPRVWEGEASSACVGQLREGAAELKRYPSGCNSIAELCAALIDMAQAAANAIATALGVLVDIAVEVLGYLAIPVAGEAAIAARCPCWALQAGRAATQATSSLARLYNAVDTFRTVVGIIKPLVDSLSAFHAAAQAGQSQIESTRKEVAHAFA